MLNTRQYSILSTYVDKLCCAIAIADDSVLYDLWAEISAVYSSDIYQIDDLYDEIKQYSGLLLRNSKALYSCITHYISENYNPIEKELISDVQHLLGRCPEALAPYQSALAKYESGEFKRNVLDDIRLSFELLLKGSLCNSKSLENNISELGTSLKNSAVSEEVRNMYVKLLDYFSKYQNEHVKHNDAVPEHEVQYIIELVSVMMKFFIQSTQGGQPQ
jgi:hypothetical protein